MRFLTICFFFVFFVNISAIHADPVVNICDDKTEWPPYLFMERVNGKPNKNKLQGAMIEILEKITEITGLEFKIELYPWKRCLFEVENFGKNKKYEVFINGSYNEERAQKYYLTAPVYMTSRGYWFSSKKFPDGPDIKCTADLKKYNVLGVLGYNYDEYGFPGNNGIDAGAKNLKAAFMKLNLGRGDILVQSAPVPYGHKAIGENIITENIVFKKLPDEKPGGFHIFISKSSPRAYELLTKINQAIVILGARGTIDEIIKKYIPCGRNC